ncbi:genetic competence negative regulator [Virgibacillus sp. W0181]|uniref:genetic competence negative regulator n=1 Tax=Virgibacillus sp. W0181 TaxID=3391581 RepID=UPI003F4607FA
MRIERVSDDQFTIFLTFDDLVERGFTRDDLWRDATNVKNLFSDMMYEASTELEFELEGLLLVHVHLMQAQGMHIIVTQKADPFDFDEEFIEMEVLLDESRELIFYFDDFEDVIKVSDHLYTRNIIDGQIYFFNNNYYVLLEQKDLKQNKEDIIAIMSEYSTPSIITSYRLKEYGKEIINARAIEKIVHYFHPDHS